MSGIDAGNAGLGYEAFGWRLLFPGAPHWHARRFEQAKCLAVMHGTAFVTGLFCWGSWLGATMLLLAYSLHVASVWHVFRQASAAGMVRAAPMFSTALGLGAFAYGPVLAAGLIVAHPADVGRGGARFLVYRSAFEHSPPSPGEWVFFRDQSTRAGSVGRVVAGPVSEVSWREGRVSVGGRLLSWEPKPRGARSFEMSLTVPQDHCLVELSAPEAGMAPGGLVLVHRSAIEGRPWLQMSPLWARRFLF